MYFLQIKTLNSSTLYQNTKMHLRFRITNSLRQHLLIRQFLTLVEARSLSVGRTQSRLWLHLRKCICNFMDCADSMPVLNITGDKWLCVVRRLHLLHLPFVKLYALETGYCKINFRTYFKSHWIK